MTVEIIDLHHSHLLPWVNFSIGDLLLLAVCSFSIALLTFS